MLPTLSAKQAFDPVMLGVHAPAPQASVTAGGGYDATRNSGRRKAPAARTRREDEELLASERHTLATSTRDLQRNFEVAAWAIRKHLDYVSTFAFQAHTGDNGLDEAVEEFVREWSKPDNCDASRRFWLPELVRMAEARRTIDGDCLVPFRKDGKLQIIEGDRVGHSGIPQTAAKWGGKPLDMQRLVNGVLLDADGGALAYVVNQRVKGGGLKFERLLDARFVHLHGYFDRYDQARGISPLASAVNRMRDVYEGFDYALAKAKVEQFFALVIMRKTAEEMGNIDPTTVTDENGDERTTYEADFGRGPVRLDMDPGDDAKFLEGSAPGANFESFTQAMIQVSLKALDIPFSFFDESHTNWVGQRQANVQYEFSCVQKRRANQYLLDRATRWRLGLAVLDGELKLPRGFDPAKLRFEWIPRGIPWIDPLKEVAGEVAAVAAGFASPQEICRAKGKDFHEIIAERAAAEDFAASMGVALSFALPAAAAAPPGDDDEGDTSGKQKKGKTNGKPRGTTTRKPRRGT